MLAYHFLHPPAFARPPDIPLPPDIGPSAWYGEIRVQYPLDQAVSPTHFGHVFRSRCQLRVIMNEFCHASFGDNREMTLAQANSFHCRLENWFENLPVELS